MGPSLAGNRPKTKKKTKISEFRIANEPLSIYMHMCRYRCPWAGRNRPCIEVLVRSSRPGGTGMFSLAGSASYSGHGCTLACLANSRNWKSVILGVWVAPGAWETLQKGGGRSPSPFARVSAAPGAAQTPKMIDCQSLNKILELFYPAKVQPRGGLPPAGRHRYQYDCAR